MKKIESIFKNLSRKEIDLIKKYFYKNFRYSRSRLLLDKINENNELDDSKIAKELYNSTSRSSFSHLKRRFKDTIFEIIYSSELAIQSNASIQSDRAKCLRLLMISSILIEKGFNDDAERYLNLANKFIIERQFTVEKIMYHTLLLEVNDCPRVNENISRKLNNNIKELYDINISKIQYHKIRTQGTYAIDFSSKANNLISNKSNLSRYYKLLSEVYSSLELFQFDKAFVYSHSLVELIQQCSACFNQREIIKAQLIHLRVLIFNKNLESAIVLCRQIEILKTPSQDLESEFIILKWLIAYYSENYLKASQYLENLVFLCNTCDTTRALINYFNLCLLFKQRKFEIIQSFLLNDNSLQSVKNPFFLAVKSLEIYCLIELGKNEFAYSKLLAFKQYLKRNDTLNKARYQFIIKVLFNMFKNDFQYEAIQSFYYRYLSASFKDDIRFVPDLYHYELVTIEEWLVMKGVEIGNLQFDAAVL